MGHLRPHPRRIATLLLWGAVLTSAVAHAATPAEEAERLAIYERIATNPSIGLGTGRALLLQLAHPKIAAGVVDHSTVARDPSTGLARLRSTATLGMALMVGDDEQASAAAAHINHVHGQVKGQVSEGTAAVAKGARYSAHDPRLQYWVLATLVDSMIKSHETFAGPLTATEKDIFTTEAFRRVGLRLKLREEHLPTSYAQVEAQVREELASDHLEIAPSAKRLGRQIAEPDIPRAVRKTMRAATVGLLPPEIRDAYDLEWGARDRRRLTMTARATRALTRSRVMRSASDRALRAVVDKAKSAPAR